MRYTARLSFSFMSIFLTAALMWAQQSETRGTEKSITADRLITFTGIIKDANGQPRIGAVGVTFKLYVAQDGGEPLWTESQTVEAGEQGRYTVLLGSATSEGLPLEVFSGGKAQWLGVQVEGGAEEARVLLVAVPYALKAADADTVGGRSLSSFVLYEDLEKLQEKGSFQLFPQGTVILPGISNSNSGSKSSAGTDRRLGLQASGGSGGRVLYSEGAWNTLFGNSAGNSLNEAGGGRYNTFIGYATGSSTTTGNYNVFMGEAAGLSNSTGTSNVFIGHDAGRAGTVTGLNAFVGYQAGRNNTTSANTFMGYQSGNSNTTGGSNAFYGYWAGRDNQTGSSNTFLGWEAGLANTASENTYVGKSAGQYSTTGDYNVFTGSGAGYINSTGSYNSFYGYRAGASNASGNNNAIFGYQAGDANTASNNSFFGYSSGGSNTSGTNNSFYGYLAGGSNSTASGNSFYGFSAGRMNTTGGQNTFFGYRSGYSNATGTNNAYYGYNSGFGSTGSYNAFYGDSTGNSNTTGINNAFLGAGSGLSNTTGSSNLFMGMMTGFSNTVGNNNTFVGAQAGYNVSSGSNTAEHNNTLVGANSLGAAGITNATAIGYQARVTQSNSLVLGSINGVNGATSNTKVGIGTTSPAAPFHVQGTFKVVQSSSPNDTIGVYQQFNTSEFSGFGYFGVEGSTPGMTVSGTSAYATLLAAGSSGSALQLGSAGVIRMTVSPSGNIGIGTTSPTAKLHVIGGVLADGFSTPSDERLKQDIQPLTYGLNEILSLRPVSFYWRNHNNNKLNLGLIAQEVERIIPELVEKGKDEAETRGMDYPALIPVLIKAVQEQEQKLAAKDAEISALNTRLSALEQILEQLAGKDHLKEK